DVMDLHRLVEERYATSRPEGYDLMLWGDLKILFQPDEEDKVIKVGDEAVHKELGDRMKRAATTASSLEAKQDSGNINRTQSMKTLNECSNLVETASKQSNDPPLSRVNKLGSGEDCMELMELMAHFMGITATIDRKVKVLVYEASIRRHLKHEDFDGLSTVPTVEIFKQLALIGYVTNSNSLTFQKGHFSPQWKFLIHPILHCVSPKLNRSLQPIKDDIQDV
ncbi:hypothetical protein Tco_0616374, partial [Tanacetum coccineum]